MFLCLLLDQQMVWTCGLDPMNGTLYPKLSHACEKGATLIYNWGSDSDTDQAKKNMLNLHLQMEVLPHVEHESIHVWFCTPMNTSGSAHWRKSYSQEPEDQRSYQMTSKKRMSSL